MSCYVLCLSSLSLLFSLFLMAPKKSVAYKNLIHCGSSSSFLSNFVQFRDEKAQNNFLENFYDQAIHLER